jgi:hypothetical protein
MSDDKIPRRLLESSKEPTRKASKMWRWRYDPVDDLVLKLYVVLVGVGFAWFAWNDYQNCGVVCLFWRGLTGQ